MKTITFRQIQNDFSTNNINSDFQLAYKTGYSTCTAPAQLTDDWLKQIGDKLLVGTVLLDFSAAFGIIDHKLLLIKLSAYGFKLSAVNWMKSYLFNRQQCVMYNGAVSSMKTLYCGVPQGSCLGPLLYSVFVNDMPHILKKCSCAIYADDTTIYAHAENVNDLSSILQHEVMQISEWVTENKMKLNISKTKCLVICSDHAQRKEHRLNISLQGVPIEQVKEARLLGVTIDERLSLATHINNIITKMSRSISIIRRSAYFLTNTTISKLYNPLSFHILIIAQQSGQMHLNKN